MEIHGRLMGSLAGGRGEVRPLGSPAQGCGETVRVVSRGGDGEGLRAGSRVVVRGVWRRSAWGSVRAPLAAGYVLAESVVGEPEPTRHGPPRPGDLAARLGGWVQTRIANLFPETHALATALVWARKDGLDPGVRDAFARAGTAHLLAISGFHVGVVAGLLLLSLSALGLPHWLRFLLASAGVWGYVLAIGLPDAAFRAALMLTVLALGRLANRSVVPLGALSTAFLSFLCLDPGALAGPGFQLSFAGALGLILGYRPLSRRLEPAIPGALPTTVRKALVGGLSAGVAATLATLPLVAWHFGRISLVGIPMTLLATPLVTLAIPGVSGSLLLSLLHPSLGSFLARGVEWDLKLLAGLVQDAAGLPFASVWVSRPTVVGGVLALVGVGIVARARPDVVRGRRVRLAVWGTMAGILLAPVAGRVMNRGVLELVVLDVGQGDALALRSPAGRWILVDAGPRTETFDAGARTVVPYLRRRGVGSLEFLLLTHPDMDHVGGAASVLRELPVGRVLDPGDPAGTGVFVEVLETARRRHVHWQIVGAGDSLNLDGVAFRILSPEESVEDQGEAAEQGANASSLVLEVRFGAFAALLTGDAPLSAEEAFLPKVMSPAVQLLKVGHHGSASSTGPELMERIRPEAVLISVGRRNRYGHPHAAVMERFRAAGVEVFRTDRDGSVVVRARADGTYRVRSGGED